MGWLVLASILLLAFLVLALRFQQRAAWQALSRSVEARSVARDRGSDKARLQYPFIDLTRCIGCGLCVQACPEDQVLDLIHGQALVVHGARCVGHGRCADACPVSAIALTLADIEKRNDIPALTEELEAPGSPGLFLAGEITGYALVRTAIAHGTLVADQVAHRLPHGSHSSSPGLLDLCVVGAGPAGLACSLRAKSHGLSFLALDQEELGGTVARYPRRKLVMTQPVELPLHGRLGRTSYQKEELIDLWRDIAQRHELPVRTGVQVLSVTRSTDGTYALATTHGEYRARTVCLALGRRGTPRKLGVPGEELPKVAYSLLDAQSYQGRRIVVVGGGDSAVEAALGLAEQPGNEVTLSYRKQHFSRLKAQNERRLAAARERGTLSVLVSSELTRIEEKEVHLRVRPAKGDERELTLDNDEVFIFAGGIPPFEFLGQAGVSFDPRDRPPVPAVGERGAGLLPALIPIFVLALAVAAWAVAHAEYYALSTAERLASPLHATLRPVGAIGLVCGVAACAAMLWNLCYLLRRSRFGRRFPGTLRTWMTSHIATGVVALLLVLVHSGFAPRNTVGGHAFIALTIVVFAGAIGRYFYAFVPRAANGRELELDELRSGLATKIGEWDSHRSDLEVRVRREIEELVAGERWRPTFIRRVAALVGSQGRLRRTLSRLRAEARDSGLTASQVTELLDLARRSHRAALMVTHYEDVRAVLASWRYVHRWLALLMILLVVLHVAVAIRYAVFDGLFGGPASTSLEDSAP